MNKAAVKFVHRFMFGHTISNQFNKCPAELLVDFMLKLYLDCKKLPNSF